MEVFSAWGRPLLSNRTVTKPGVFETVTVRENQESAVRRNVSSQTQPLSQITNSCKEDSDGLGRNCASVIIRVHQYNTQDKKRTYNVMWRLVRTNFCSEKSFKYSGVC